MPHKNTLLWITWIGLTAALTAWLLGTLFGGEEKDKSMFMPGTTTAGHYQIEQACDACHGESFSDAEAIQSACMGCHGEALKVAKDDHPKSKFTDPRNADRIEALDARYCVTCHVEHRPGITHEMGVTVPKDTCYLCHDKVAEDRPSHEGMAFATCTSAGCHNFHDNRALYEDFLLKHAGDADTEPGALLLSNLRDIAEQLPDYPLDSHPLDPITLADQSLPADLTLDAQIAEEWLASSHAAAGVGCSGCHMEGSDSEAEWVASPGHSACETCHKGEVSGFLSGRHGMRLDSARLGRNLSPMTPAMARLAMKADAMNRELDCQSCHGAHGFDSRKAAVESCLGCHDDEHSVAYIGSPHHQLWQAEMSGETPAGTGVSCASCHLPRVEKDYYWGTFVHNEVVHNQSDTIRPNEKMLRPVCLECHGLGFAIDALADPASIRSNFSSPPGVHIESIDLARKRVEALSSE